MSPLEIASHLSFCRPLDWMKEAIDNLPKTTGKRARASLESALQSSEERCKDLAVELRKSYDAEKNLLDYLNRFQLWAKAEEMPPVLLSELFEYWQNRWRENNEKPASLIESFSAGYELARERYKNSLSIPKE